jgi:hypothetical protein
LEAVSTYGAEAERLKSADPEKVTLHPASSTVHVNGQFEGFVLFRKMLKREKQLDHNLKLLVEDV